METYVIFTNYDGKYYLETVSSLDIEKLQDDWDIERVMDNYNQWQVVMMELSDPTISNGKQLAVKQDCYE